MIAGLLEIQMLANLARLADDMNKAKSMVGSSMKSIESAVSTAKSALGALGIGLSVGYFTSLIKGSIDALDHLNDLSKSTNIAVETLAGLQLAAKQSGGDLDSIASSINKLSVEMGKQPEKFRALGVSAKDPLEAFKQLSDIYVKLEDPQQRAAVMAVALSKSWAGAAPLLAEGGQKIGEMVEKGARLSGVTKEMTKQADEYNDQMAELNVTLGATRTKLVGDMLPGLNRIAEAMREAAKEGGLLQTVLVGIGGAIQEALGDSPLKKAQQNVVDLTAKLKYWEEQQKTGPIMRFLIRHDYEKELANARGNLDNALRILELEKAKLLPPAAPSVPEVDPAVAAAAAKAAAAAAAKFLAAQKSEAELKQFTNALQALEKQIFAVNHEGAASATIYETTKGSLIGLTAAHKAALLAKAQELDALKRDVDMRNMVLVGIEAENVARTASIAIVADFAVTNREFLDQQSFELALIGKSAREREVMNALRRIDLDLRQKIAALPTDSEGNLLTGAADAITALRAQADAQKRAVIEGLAERTKAERDWLTGAKDAFNEYMDHATNAAEQSAMVIGNAFRSMEDALVEFVRTGKLDFRSLADSIIADLIRIQVRQSIAQAAGPGGLNLSNLFGTSTSGPEQLSGPGMPAFASGTNFVPRTGLALVHKGERIIPASQNNGGGDTYYIDARGADAAGMARLETMIKRLDGTIERRAVTAYSEIKRR
jgi:lambda family phage tail tape measure protein